MPDSSSVAKLYRDFSGRWEIEPVPPGTRWIAVQREPGGDFLPIVVAHEVGTLRFRMTEAERETPEERENDGPGAT